MFINGIRVIQEHEIPMEAINFVKNAIGISNEPMAGGRPKPRKDACVSESIEF